uniref:Cadherin domain-containing protein n=1 Tax=Romanomermis culicivorax TaxID=13658 RepID=A0A915J6R9_ROMCU
MFDFWIIKRIRSIQSSGILFYISSGHKINDSVKFSLDEKTGQLSTNSKLDREEQQSYVLTVYVRDGEHASKYDVASVIVTLLDENDNAPKIASSSCYPFSVPEGRSFGNLSTIVAVDRDSGQNGEIEYSLEGNSDGNFFIDSSSGQLSCRALDREKISFYDLAILATDKGYPKRLTDRCNLRITVLDDNDNDPIFDPNSYNFEIPENLPLGSNIKKPVSATDKDEGLNGFLTFNILNESSGTFDIDSRSGQIKLIRHLSYGKQQNYSFRVEAVDHGQPQSRKSSAVVFVRITDVNDNAPFFSSVPLSFKADAFVRSGQRIAKVTAKDADGPGPNSDVYYSFVNKTENHQQFSINPSTGVISVKRDLNFRPGTVVYLRIFASDKGQQGPLKSMGVVQILVRDSSFFGGTIASQPVVKFDKEKYEVTIVENASSKKQVVRVGVLAPVKDVIFGIIWGNEDKAFAIEAKTGKIFVSDNKNLKWSPGRIRRLIVEAAANFRPEHGSQANMAYAEVLVYLEDSNDHSPQFVQQRYFTSIREGMPSGTFVSQVMAVDHDAGENAQISYSIVGGNLDSAFRIDTKGVIRTNAQLDREIVDRYILTINSADFGTPVRTSSVILDVQINDVNDNKPSFPSFSTINLTENAEVGTYVTTIGANDVDIYPPLVYSFMPSGNPENFFGLNTFSGRLILIKPLDHEKQGQHNLKIQASDGLHNTSTNLKIEVLDENDNSPIFDQQFYQISIPIGTKIDSNIGRVKAKDSDSGKNAEISFRLFSDDSSSLNLWVDSSTGNIYLNSSITSEMQQVPLSEFKVEAKDKGQPPKSSLATVHVQIVNDLVKIRPQFLNATYRFVVREDVPVHSRIGTLTTDLEASYSQFQIVDQKFIVDSHQDDATFFIDSDGNLILLKNLDRESKSVYQFDVRLLVKTTNQKNSDRALCSVYIEIEDANDNSPQFNQLFYQILIDDQFFDQNSGKIRDVSLLKISAQDEDSGENGMIFYELSSGQASDKFRIDPDTGHFMVKNMSSLVTESSASASAFKLIVKASDRGKPSRSSFTSVEVKVDIRKNRISIFFPLSLYLGRIYENEKPGTHVIFTATALCSEGCNKSIFAYSISGDDAAFFHMDPKLGDLYSAISFDYEARTSFNIALNVRDVENRTASANAQILVKGKDEFAPAFSQPWYEFRVDFQMNVGDMAGAVYATDRDLGFDGQVTFNLKKQNSYFAVSPETGTILVTRSLLFLKKVFDKNFTNLPQDDAKHLLDNQVDFETRKIILRIVAYSGSDPSSGQVNETMAFVTLGDFNLSLLSTSGQITSLTVVLVLVVLSIMWRTKCKLDYSNKPNSCRKISYPKRKKNQSSIFGGERIDLNLDIYHDKILNANDGNARKVFQSALNNSSKRKFDKQILDATSSSSQQKGGGSDKVWTCCQISSMASDKFVCECKNSTIRSTKRSRNLTTTSNVSKKSSGRDSVIV